jgi:hypothetical protein
MHRFFPEPGLAHLSDVNRQKVQNLRDVMDKLLDRMLVRNFHGIGTVKISVQDGTILAIEESVERKHR